MITKPSVRYSRIAIKSNSSETTLTKLFTSLPNLINRCIGYTQQHRTAVRLMKGFSHYTRNFAVFFIDEQTIKVITKCFRWWLLKRFYFLFNSPTETPNV